MMCDVDIVEYCKGGSQLKGGILQRVWKVQRFEKYREIDHDICVKDDKKYVRNR